MEHVVLKLPASEFDILRQDQDGIVIYDKVVDKVYTYVREEKKWKFPKGSRVEVIYSITGFNLNP